MIGEGQDNCKDKELSLEQVGVFLKKKLSYFTTLSFFYLLERW